MIRYNNHNNSITTRISSILMLYVSSFSLLFLILSLSTTITVVNAFSVSTALASTSASVNNNNNIKTVLVTGGSGYIGSHTCLELLEEETIGNDDNNDNNDNCNCCYNVVVIDNLDNSSKESLKRVEKLLSKSNKSSMGDKKKRLFFRKCDIRDKITLNKILDEFPNITSCIHFAGLKAVGESVTKPLQYYNCNIIGTINLLEILSKRNIKKFVFSSSATVYGEPNNLPISEESKLQNPTSPYGRTKLFIEEILRDLQISDTTWKIYILRYFNPIGAHSSGIIGEDPNGIPNNLMPFISQVCIGRRDKLSIFGNDYNTKDGTGIRDYIHVVDLAKGHVAAINKLYSSNEDENENDNNDDDNNNIGYCKSINLGTGNGVSVLELVKGMEKATGSPVPYEIVNRRPGDVAELYADPTLSKEELNWKATLTVNDMCIDTWKWQKNNPYGYNTNTNTDIDVEEEEEKEKEEEVIITIDEE